MRKWTIGLLALAGSALAFAPGAMAQSEFGEPYSDWVWDEYDTETYYTPPTVGQMVPPPAAVAPAPGPGISYFSPPAAAPTAPAAAAPTAPVVGAGECGTYFYWSESLGRCVDARAK